MAAFQAYADDYGKIIIRVNRNFYGGKSDFFYLTSDEGMYVDLVVNRLEEYHDFVRYELVSPADMQLGVEYFVHDSHGMIVPLQIRLLTHSPIFLQKYDYDGDDLGPTYHKQYTDFALWAPTATGVSVKVINGEDVTTQTMKRCEKGVYRTRIEGDLADALYTYLISRNGETVETCDPYALSSDANGSHSAIIDESRLANIATYKPTYPIEHNTDAIIYECSIRDMTSGFHSGTKTHGKYLSLTEDFTQWNGYPTSLSYVRRLGVTHVQFQPVLDFATVDEEHPDRHYNWGYDPSHYMCLEGSYSSNPHDPYARMKEFKTLVSVLHKNNMRVTLDVVFNHMYDVDGSMFQKIVPYYYYRYNNEGYLSNGSYCGNDMSSTSPMVKRYFAHVVKKLIRLYDVDGFRFDLMGILDVSCMNELYATVKQEKKDALVYGEGWDMPTLLEARQKSCIVNQDILPDIGHFNDYFRDTVKGRTADDAIGERGYLTGDIEMAFAMCSAIAGNVLHEPYFYRFSSPCKTINSIETHDNGTAWDKMRVCNGNENHDIRLLRMKMLNAAVLFSIGVPFLHAGQEYCGTKNDNSNSYNAGDAINQMNWDRSIINRDVVSYTQKAIALRKAYKAFRLATGEEVARSVNLQVLDGGVVVMDVHYEDDATNTDMIRVFFNPTYVDHVYDEPFMMKTIFDKDGNTQPSSYRLHVPNLSVVVYAREKSNQQ